VLERSPVRYPVETLDPADMDHGTECKSTSLDLLIRARMLKNCTCSHRAGSDLDVTVAAGKRRCIHVWLIVRAIVR
jgi:hypothetical protein